ncbi:MAG: hypothetical protein AB7F85_04520 [Hyphomonadaceae bacterium]
MVKDADENREQIAETQRRLGELAIQFSGVDVGFEKVFLALTKLPLPLGGIIFYNHDATSRRRDLLDKIAKQVLAGNTGLLERWESLRKEHAEIHERRNRFVHDLWAIDQTGTYVTARASALAGVKSAQPIFSKVDDEELKALGERASDLMMAAIDFSSAIRQAL